MGGRWVSEAESYKARGYVQYQGEWITPAEHEALLRERAADDARDRERQAAETRAREAEARAAEAEARAAEAEAEQASEGIPLWYGWGAGPAYWPTGPVVRPNPPRPAPRSAAGAEVSAMNARIILAAVALLAPPAVAAETVDEIVARHVAARGGREALAAVRAVRMTGRATAGPGRQAIVRREIARPGRIRTELEFQGTTGVWAWDGSAGWRVSPLDGGLEPEALPAEEAASLAEQADLEGPLVDWKAKGHAVEVVGQETLPGGLAHRLKVTPKSGAPRTVWVDAATGLVVRTESTRRLRGRDVVLETVFAMPGYETRLAVVLHSLADSLAARGIDLPDWKAIEALSPSRLVGYASSFLGAVMSAFSDGFLVLLLVLFIIVDGADRRFKYDQGLLPPDSWWGQVYRGGADVRRYVSITAFTGLLGAIANLILLLVLGVDGAVLWAFLSFWLNFIPNVGIILSVIPPALLALVEFGPGRAIVVVVGFILANAVVEQVLQPRLIGRELELSPLEILVSLLFWSWVLGPIGAVVAVPLTIAVKRLLPALATGLTLPGRDRP